MRDRIAASQLAQLRRQAQDAAAGRIVAFSRWVADYGNPVDWHLNPTNGRRWEPRMPWARLFATSHTVGDVKLTWEVARFPHAYVLARAATFHPDLADELSGALISQLEGFIRDNPYGLGVHWASGQEVVFRLMAWLFALKTLLSRGPRAAAAAELIAQALLQGITFVAQHIDYARLAVYNNHLLSEALGLYLFGALFPELPRAQKWHDGGRTILDAEAERQVYSDGGYIQQSHNYHRVALQDFLWACAVSRRLGMAPSRSWHSAMERSLDLLVAHQSPADGSLPNYGANDGAQPSILSTCAFSDFRPTLQAVSLECRGERLYEPGPWDELSAWFLGPNALEAPLRAPHRRSVSFGSTGYHVLRSRDESTFATFRCGSIRDRFSQIDMLHLDVWWKGQNVLVDPGSYLYNGPETWHAHFLRTESHNTLALDGRDQMLHFRRFKSLYWTQAELLRFEVGEGSALVAGEHHGYQRHEGGCIHRRAVLFLEPALWVVVDSVRGAGQHLARLHWLGGPFPFHAEPGLARLTLDTPEGPFSVTCYDTSGRVLPGDVVAGREDPPRGWLSRHYAEKEAAPSLAVEQTTGAPFTWISVLGANAPELAFDGRCYRVGEVELALSEGIPVRG